MTTETTTPAQRPRTAPKIMRDFALGGLIFASAVALWDVAISPASNLGPKLATTLVDPAAMPSLDAWSRSVWTDLFSPAGHSRTTMLVLLGTGFAAAVAFNLAIVRHLRSAYARPARRPRS
jgi:glycerol uptake facilitator-like aquaporin